MARMKFLCDADRCIECNACVTACKNEHDVPWGINRRRVVTINDGKPGERSISMACMHCTDAPCAAVCPVDCFYTTADAVVLHSKDLCIGCGYCFYACPFGAPQYPRVGNFGSRGKMDKCTYLRRRPGGRLDRGRVRPVRRQPAGRGQAAALRRDVLDQVAARRRRRDHRGDLQGAGDAARLRLRRLGLADGLPRDGRGLTTAGRAGRPAATERPMKEGGGSHAGLEARLDRPLPAARRDRSGARAAGGARPRRRTPSGSNPTAQAVSEAAALATSCNKIAGPRHHPDPQAATLEQPQGRDFAPSTRARCPGSAASSSSACWSCSRSFYFVAGRIRDREGAERGRQDPALQRARALHALADGDRLHRARDHRPELHLRQAPADAADRRRTPSRPGRNGRSTRTTSSSWAFMLGVLIMLVVWVRDNLPDRYDATWLKAGGGLFDKSHAHPPARPLQRRAEAHLLVGDPRRRRALGVRHLHAVPVRLHRRQRHAAGRSTIHAIVGVILIAVIIAHIYIGIARHGGRLRRDGLGRGRPQLGASSTTAPGSRSSRRRPRAARQVTGAHAAPAE